MKLESIPLQGRGLTANALHPGFVGARMASENGLLVRQIMRLARLFAKNPAHGARTSAYPAASSEGEGISGRFFEECRDVRSDPASYDEAVARRLWAVSEAMTRVQFLPGSPSSRLERLGERPTRIAIFLYDCVFPSPLTSRCSFSRRHHQNVPGLRWAMSFLSMCCCLAPQE